MKISIAHRKVSGAVADRLSLAFYGGVAAIALAGQISAAEKLHLPMLIAVPGMVLLELGGVTLAARADFRRRLGETALWARLLSAFCAGVAVAINWVGHKDTSLFAAAVLAFFSALGYLVWLINSGDRRRDQLREEGKLPPTAPVYGLVQWLRHPWLTRRARALALADPSLGLYGSLATAKEAVRAEIRQAAIAAELHEQLANSVNPTAARIAVATYDLDKVAARLAAGADYDGLTALLEASITKVLLGATAEVAATRKAAQSSTGKRCPEGCKCRKHTPVRRVSTGRRTNRRRGGSRAKATEAATGTGFVMPTAEEIVSLTKA